MKQYNFNFIKNYYENSFFIFNFSDALRAWSFSSYYTWKIADSFNHLTHIKRFFFFCTCSSVQKKKKLLFIIDIEYLKMSGSLNVFLKNFISTSIKDSLTFLSVPAYSSQIAGIICLSKQKNFPIIFFKKYNIPIFHLFYFTGKGDYNIPINLAFHNSIVFLFVLMEQLIYEKKKPI